MRIVLCALLLISTAQAAQIVVDVPPISTGRTVSSVFTLQPEGIILSSSGSTSIGAEVPTLPGYELTSLFLYLGGYHGDPNALQPGWHGTLNGNPIAPTSMEPVLFSVPTDNFNMEFTSDVPDQIGIGVIAFGRALTEGLPAEEDCSVALPVFPLDCQSASQPYQLAFRAVFSNDVPEPWGLPILGLLLLGSLRRSRLRR